jgi:hypothetical protein
MFGLPVNCRYWPRAASRELSRECNQPSVGPALAGKFLAHRETEVVLNGLFPAEAGPTRELLPALSGIDEPVDDAFKHFLPTTHCLRVQFVVHGMLRQGIQAELT